MDNGYTIKRASTFTGHDGYGVECVLLNPEGRKVGVCVDDGWGGGYQYHDFTEEDRASLEDFCKALPTWQYDGEQLPTTSDMYVERLAADWLDAKAEKKWITNKTRREVLFRLVGMEEGRYQGVVRSFKVSDKAATMAEETRIVEFIQDKYGEKVECIVGLRSRDDIVA